MPEHTIHLNEADARLVRRIQARLGLASLDAAAQWLVKARLRRTARMVARRGRAIYLVQGGRS